jgi:hypothetical protein
VGSSGPLPSGPVLPEWVTDTSELQDMVIGWVVEWLVNGLWKGAVEVVGWIQQLFQEAIIRPSTAAGGSLMDAAGGVGDVLLDVMRSLVDVLYAVAASSPLAPIILAVLAAFLLVGFAYLLRAGLETVKLVSWK